MFNVTCKQPAHEGFCETLQNWKAVLLKDKTKHQKMKGTQLGTKLKTAVLLANYLELHWSESWHFSALESSQDQTIFSKLAGGRLADSV